MTHRKEMRRTNHSLLRARVSSAWAHSFVAAGPSPQLYRLTLAQRNKDSVEEAEASQLWEEMEGWRDERRRRI